MRTIKDLDLNNKKVLVRVDFNVPLNANYEITDDTRMQKAMPTIKYLLSEGAAVILCSHLGRPQKKKNEDGTINVKKYTLKHVVEHLASLTGAEVQFASDCVGGETELMAERLEAGQILLLENTRFYAGESKGDLDLAIKLSRLAEIYVNDAFGTAHRAHASTATVAQYFKPENKALGFLMHSEIESADKLLKSPKRPVVAIVGGAKVSDKIKLLEKLIEVVNHVCIGGGMAYTFKKALGGSIGQSLCEDEYMDLALEILAKAKDLGTEIHLPIDTLIADDFNNEANTDVVDTNHIPDDWQGLDIGPKTIEAFRKVVLGAQSILWNGPMGVFEMETFAKGTNQIALAVGEATQNGAYSLIGGGDSVAAINKAGLSDKVSFISTGGGAMLEYLEGKVLPGIKAISE
ncbi:MAG: phosphoglycerate kinase [Saprospiraceae bacterium]|nr:phosphoglycerate kinase [Saprospiraceae bacterium]